MFEKFLLFLDDLEMEIPTTWGWFHIMWWLISVAVVVIFIYYKTNKKEMNDKLVFGIYGFGSLILELAKQLMWSVRLSDGVVVWDYQWYAAPFQLCTTPMFVSIALVFVNNKKVRQYLLSYLGLITIISSLSVMIVPNTCFTEDIIINIHTMYLHFGGFVMALYVHIFNKIEMKHKSLLEGFIVFLIFVCVALVLDIVVYKSGLCGNETFNMFYISPYFESMIPGFNVIQQYVAYPFFLMIYILAFLLAGNGVFLVIKLLKDKLLNI